MAAMVALTMGELDRLQVMTQLAAPVGWIDVVRDDERHGLRIARPEVLEGARIQVARGPLAFDRDRRLPAPREHEIDLVPLLVPPITDVARLEPAVDLVEDVVLPQGSEVVASRSVPAPRVAHEPRAEPVDLGSRDDLLSRNAARAGARGPSPAGAS